MNEILSVKNTIKEIVNQLHKNYWQKLYNYM